MPTILGASLSPFVRKTRVFCAEKGIDVQLQPVFPGSPDAAWRKKSPLGKIPCLEDGDFTLPDSSCICAYLERVHPQPALYPADVKEYGRALWYEEYADTKLLEVTAPPFFQRIVRPLFLKQETDEAAVRRALEEVAPTVFGYLEAEIGDREYLVGSRFSIADIAVATQLVNFQHGRERVPRERFPKLASYAERIHARPSFKALIEEEKASLPS
jgi:glutathione S-transferase